ncbi:MAG: hypothetical protein Q7S02_05195 [bacterium]|nr:hypothetical protein [bacterium]
MARFTESQLLRLAALERAYMAHGGSGFHDDVEVLLRRFESAKLDERKATAEDPRIARARILYRRGWADTGGARTFAQYLAGIPPIPDVLLEPNEVFPDLMLEDQRPFRVRGQPLRLRAACAMLGVGFRGDDRTFVDVDTGVADAEVQWIRVHDGLRYRGYLPQECRAAFVEGEFGTTLFQGLSLCAHRSNLPLFGGSFSMQLPGTVTSGKPRGCASLSVWQKQVQVNVSMVSSNDVIGCREHFGSSTRWVPKGQR